MRRVTDVMRLMGRLWRRLMRRLVWRLTMVADAVANKAANAVLLALVDGGKYSKLFGGRSGWRSCPACWRFLAHGQEEEEAKEGVGCSSSFY